MNLMPAVADCHFQGWFHPHILIMDIVPLPTRNWGGGSSLPLFAPGGPVTMMQGSVIKGNATFSWPSQDP